MGQSLFNNSFGTGQQTAMNNALGQAQSYNNALAAQQLGRPRYNPRWMIDGRELTLHQFADELFGDDTPEKTHFLLKYSK
tara:strand:- start:259 stop:498 length:240 start_codon:yes stop_codon:yes gene_type:complete